MVFKLAHKHFHAQKENVSESPQLSEYPLEVSRAELYRITGLAQGSDGGFLTQATWRLAAG